MSVRASTWAWDQKTGGAKSVLLALADQSDDYGVTVVGHERVARMCECDCRTVGRHMKALEEKGIIARVRRTRGNGSRTSDYTILAPNAAERGSLLDCPPDIHSTVVMQKACKSGPDNLSGDTGVGSRPVSGGGKALFSDQAGEEQKKEEKVRETTPPSVSAQLSVVPSDFEIPKKVGGIAVTEYEATLASECLRTFNRRGNTAFRSKSMIEKIVRRIREHPELALADHDALLDRAFRNPWWGDVRPRDVGVVYGNQAVFERAIANDGRAATSAAVARHNALQDEIDRLDALGGA